MVKDERSNVRDFVKKAVSGELKELSIFGDDYNTRDGSCIRDYIDVVDLAKAHVLAITRILEKDADAVEVFNLGTGNGVSVLELVHNFEEATGVKLNYRIAPRRPGDVEQVYADCTKANEVLGWKAQVPLKETLLNAWNWQKKLRENSIM